VDWILIVAVLGVFVALRHYAIRRVAAGRGRFVWLMFGQTLIGGVGLLWVAAQMFARAPLAGVGMALIAGAYLLVLGRFLLRLSHSVSSAGSQDEIAAAMGELFLKYIVAWMGVVLLGSFALLLWAVAQGGRPK
jgi:hypothetical protein